MTAGTEYTWKAYSASGCGDANAIATAQFRTAGSASTTLSVVMVTQDNPDAGEYRALACCKSGSTYSSAHNLMGAPSASLARSAPSAAVRTGRTSTASGSE